jgi:hypothetical protein
VVCWRENAFHRKVGLLKRISFRRKLACLRENAFHRKVGLLERRSIPSQSWLGLLENIHSVASGLLERKCIPSQSLFAEENIHSFAKLACAFREYSFHHKVGLLKRRSIPSQSWLAFLENIHLAASWLAGEKIHSFAKLVC